jgi:hypothetical protein
MRRVGILFAFILTLMLIALPVNAMESETQNSAEVISNTSGDMDENVTEVEHKHKYVKYVVAPSCTEKGYTLYVCECGEGSYVGDYVDMLDHTYKKTVIKEATHYEEGEALMKCVCGKSYTTVIEKTPHTYTTIVTPPTCLNPQYTTYTCAECGYSYRSDYKEPMAHSYVVTDILVEATCVKDSYAIYTCQCGESYMDLYVPARGHNYEGNTCVDCGSVCSCNCHKTGFMGFIWKIELLFNRLFKTNKECHCGVVHY